MSKNWTTRSDFLTRARLRKRIPGGVCNQAAGIRTRYGRHAIIYLTIYSIGKASKTSSPPSGR
jgi:hypothetical protein